MPTPTDPDPANPLGSLILLAVLILVNAFFSMSEIAVIALNMTKVERMAAAGDKRAKNILKLTKNSGRFLSMIQIMVTLAGFLASASAASKFSPPLLRLLERVVPPAAHSVLDDVVTFLITLVISYVTLVLAELVPKRLAMKYPERISLRSAGVLNICGIILRPLVWVVSASANGVLRLFGIDPNASEEEATEENIRLLVDASGERGLIEEVQQEMIHNIFELDDINVGDIMTHRTEIVGIEVEEPLKQVVKASIAEGCSRIPAYKDDLDDIVGIVYIKDLLGYIGTELPGEIHLRNVMREPYFVPETKRCGELFKEMTEQHIQIAIVVDEYGGTAGLVTLEDVLESIVGSIQDEYDNEEEEISKIDETTFMIEGNTDIEEVNELIGMELPEGEYDTVAGFVIDRLGYLPKQDDRPVVEYKHLRFTVEELEDKRISAIKVEILPKGNGSEA